MNEMIYRLMDIADYALCRARLLSFPSWADFQRSNSRKLYAGKLRRALPQYATHFGITPFFASTRNISHDVTQPFGLPDSSLDAFQSEDVFEHIEVGDMVPIFNEIYRVLVPGGLFRLSLPDYHAPLYRQRCEKGADGEIVFDPGGGGSFVDGKVTGGGHVWFPAIETVRDLFSRSSFSGGVVNYLQYNNADGSFECQAIDHELGYIQRTPDHDHRGMNGRPISIVVDAYKAK